MNGQTFTPLVSLLQGVYYFATGIWPILSRRTFELITGPKVDFWLVRTIGGLITVVSAVLMMAGLRRRVSPETAVLAVGSAASLAASDVIYASKGRISKIYLVESAAEIILIAMWITGWRLDSRQQRASVLKLPPE